MSIAARPLFAFDDTDVRELEGLSVPWQATPAPRSSTGVFSISTSQLSLDAA